MKYDILKKHIKTYPFQNIIKSTIFVIYINDFLDKKRLKNQVTNTLLKTKSQNCLDPRSSKTLVLKLNLGLKNNLTTPGLILQFFL